MELVTKLLIIQYMAQKLKLYKKRGRLTTFLHHLVIFVG